MAQSRLFPKMSYHGPRDNGEGRPRDVSHHGPRGDDEGRPEDTPEIPRLPTNRGVMISSSSSTLTPMRELTNTAVSIIPTHTREKSTDQPLATTAHLAPILTVLRGNRSRVASDDRSRSPPLRDMTASPSNATSRRLQFCQGSSTSLPLVESLSSSMEGAIREALQVLPHHQVRAHIQAILGEAPGQVRAMSTISTRLATFAANRHDRIEGN